MSNAIVGATLLSELHERMEEKISEYKGWYFIQAIAFMCAGVLALVLPAATTLGFNVVIGALLAISGVVKGFTSFKSHIHWWSLLSAAISVVLGCLMLLQPVPGIVAFATLVAVYLLTDGLTEIFLALEFESARNWGWLMLAGVVSILLSLILFIGWPGMTAMVLAVMIGINLLFYGASLLALSAVTPDYDTL